MHDRMLTACGTDEMCPLKLDDCGILTFPTVAEFISVGLEILGPLEVASFLSDSLLSNILDSCVELSLAPSNEEVSLQQSFY